MAGSPAASLVRACLDAVARRVGADGALHLVSDLLDASFPYPAGHAAYDVSVWIRGKVPCLLSFAEREPAALRIFLEPFGPGALPETRRRAAMAWAADMASRHLGDEAASAWIADMAGAGGELCFGALLGATLNRE